MNYFKQFGLPVAFDLDASDLENRYLKLQTNSHPDAQKGELADSISINKAYEILKSPLRRACYLLKLSSNIDLENDEALTIKVDPEILEKILVEREHAAEIKSDKSKTLQLIKSLAARADSLINEGAKKIAEQNYSVAAKLLIEAKYLNKIRSDLKSDLRV